MNQQIYIVFEDNEQPEQMPLLGIFSFSEPVDEAAVRKTIDAALMQWKAEMDCPPVRFAADEICKAYGGDVQFVEAGLITIFPIQHMMNVIFQDLSQPEKMPVTACFTFEKFVRISDVQKTISTALHEQGFLSDRLLFNYASECVCKKYGGTVQFTESALAYGLSLNACSMCPKCGVAIPEDADNIQTCMINQGVLGEAKICHACWDLMHNRGELLRCERCGEYYAVEVLKQSQKNAGDPMLFPCCGWKRH